MLRKLSLSLSFTLFINFKQ